MSNDRRKTWEIRVGVYASEEQAEDLQNRIQRLLCPDPSHRPPCPIPWSIAVSPAGSEHDDLVEQYLLEALLEQIHQGVLRPGEALPSQARLADDHGVSRERVRKVIAKLGEAGLVETVRGRGTFVRQAA